LSRFVEPDKVRLLQEIRDGPEWRFGAAGRRRPIASRIIVKMYENL